MTIIIIIIIIIITIIIIIIIFLVVVQPPYWWWWSSMRLAFVGMVSYVSTSNDWQPQVGYHPYILAGAVVFSPPAWESSIPPASSTWARAPFELEASYCISWIQHDSTGPNKFQQAHGSLVRVLCQAGRGVSAQGYSSEPLWDSEWTTSRGCLPGSRHLSFHFCSVDRVVSWICIQWVPSGELT